MRFPRPPAWRANDITVRPGQRVLVYRDGVLERVLEPGRYRVRGRVETIPVDVRQRIVPVAPQEVPTADGVSVRISLSLRMIVTDPVAYLEVATDPVAAVYLAAQLALRDAVAGMDVQELMSHNARVDVDAIHRAAAEAAAPVGIDVRKVAVKDILVPHEMRSAAIDLITAKARGLAQLEVARGETAALRALANAGRMLDANPALAQLRMVQSAPPGARVVLSIGGAGASATDD